MWPIKFFFSGTLLITFTFMPSFLSSALGEIFYSDFQNSYSLASFIFSVFILVYVCFFIIQMMIFGIKVHNLRSHKLVRAMFQSFINPLKEKWIIYGLIYPLYLIRFFLVILLYYAFSNGIGHTFV